LPNKSFASDLRSLSGEPQAAAQLPKYQTPRGFFNGSRPTEERHALISRRFPTPSESAREEEDGEEEEVD